MTPRAFYRWKSFWLGVVALVFMGWTSWKSVGSYYYLTVGGGSRGYVQMVKLEAGTGFLFDPSAYSGISFEERRQDASQGRFPVEAYWEYLQRSVHGVRFVVVPDRLLFFCFLGLWGGGMIWQWSREQKKLECA